MKIIRISKDDIPILKIFVDNLGKSSTTFRYFDKRPISILEQHLCTFLLINNDNIPIGYGHLEKEDEITWLGIALIETETKKGFGKIIMNELISFGKNAKINHLCLSVDKSNSTAQNFYMHFGFIKTLETNSKIFMKKTLSDV